jgi:hypothetical protein
MVLRSNRSAGCNNTFVLKYVASILKIVTYYDSGDLCAMWHLVGKIFHRPRTVGLVRSFLTVEYSFLLLTQQ